MQYYLTVTGQVVGPMTAEQVFGYNPDPNTMVCGDGENWQPLYTFPELMLIYNRQNNSNPRSELESKKVLCGIMAMLFGCLGVHYFILGKTSAGFITILLSLITCGFWQIIVLIQGIMMLCMNSEDFRRKYIDNPATFPLF